MTNSQERSLARPDNPIPFAIVICTFRREQLLAQALDSIAAQHCPPTLKAHVIVVDNSDDGSARSVVEERVWPFEARWLAAHPANISVARNAGVAAVDAPWFAFLDDDQQMAEGWLDAVADAILHRPCDVYFGAVEPTFERPDLATPFVRQLFSRELDGPAGEPLIAMGPRKTRGVALATNNSIFRRAALPVDDPLFDLAFGKGGGEDYDLFCRMQSAGRSLAWLPGARAREFVPASRCDPAYLRRRFFAGGQAFAAAVAKSSARPTLMRWALRCKAALQLVALSLRFPFAAAKGRTAMRDHHYLICGAFGKLSLEEIHQIYGNTESK